MATKIWRGDSPAIAQVDTLAIGGTIEVGDKFTVTINGKSMTYIATSTTAATCATGFVTQWNALSSTAYPEFAEITAAEGVTGSLTLTADTAGKPFTISVATTESNGDAADAQTFTRTATTANSGPNCAAGKVVMNSRNPARALSESWRWAGSSVANLVPLLARNPAESPRSF